MTKNKNFTLILFNLFYLGHSSLSAYNQFMQPNGTFCRSRQTAEAASQYSNTQRQRSWQSLPTELMSVDYFAVKNYFLLIFLELASCILQTKILIALDFESS
jgi:hypothetical protein